MPKFSNRVSLIAFLALASVVSAQPVRKPAGAGEEKFRPFRLDVKVSADQANRVNQMKNASVNLDPPSEDDKKVLREVAKNYVYPITHHENYFTPDGPELVAKSYDAPSVSKVLATFKSQLNFAVPGAQPAPTQIQLGYIREYGAAAVEAIQDVLAKNPPAPIRINVMRMLAMVAESGAPAALVKVTELLDPKKVDAMPVDQLYYALKTAEGALGSYDKDRGNKWVSRNQYHQLVTLVDGIVQKVPDNVIRNAYIPERPFNPTLSTDPKPADPKSNQLLPEQVDAAQVFRLQAIRALGKVRTDLVLNETLDKTTEVRPLNTLALVAVSDPTIVPSPNIKEIGEAIIGIVTMTPSDTVQAKALGLILTRATSDFINDKAAQTEISKDTIHPTHWKLFGTRLKNAVSAWEKEIQSPRVKLSKADKDTLTDVAQTLTTAVFDPLTKQTETTNAAVNKTAVDGWFGTKFAELKDPKSINLYTDKPALKVTLQK